MGQRGPQPTPTAIAKRRDSTVLYERDCEPIFEVGIPDPPAWLDDHAISEWDRITSDPTMLSVLCFIDQAILAVACEEYSRYVRASQYIRENGETYIDGKTGNPRKHPMVDVMSTSREGWMRAKATLGLSPADRTRVKTHDGTGHEFGRDPRGRKRGKGKPRNVTPLVIS